MTDQDLSMTKGRETFLQAARRELMAFEHKERKFRKRTKLEDAEELHLPLENAELHSL